ncbi:bifunctional diguanylate cyclase/phosphodiesterase [Solirubrobacter phytolaccae]|uniref:Bifunctional diguanylate cyclase/phosphodiesterase n=1 Tax=Solirubrobacter phytolaccae TaxID=1404360 RepID=A0A9X3N911_9ACTN|nr:bifunctional diguanylate cyclase/phosphodiesterase [Solirubrobacter phytolaccae]MDA0182008.1 bifunctional diguanylate cyclase/phosphodiesterase [Solirubrobacter phytolaccae]
MQIGDESARLSALRDVGLLDAEPDPALERLTRLAGELLGVPISLVTLVADGRQYFAGATGLEAPLDRERETPLSHSCCRHVVERRAPLVVDDCRESSLLAENLGVRDYGVMAYAGMPLTLDGGETLGAFCAVDKVPHPWSEREVRLLEELAALAVDVLEARRASGRELRDRLTGLAGRALFGELVARSIARGVRGDRSCAVLAFGLDGFRLVNDALGHAAGDELLQSVATRLSTALRSGDAACRLAGDEFLVLCDALEDEGEAEMICDRLVGELTRGSHVAGGHAVPVSLTVGVSTTSTVVAADDLIDAAVDALARRKRGAHSASGRPDPERRVRATRRLRLQQALHGVEERDELTLVYQPLVELRGGGLKGFEALLRWTHPELGPVRPDEFIPVAERSGAIVPIGEWVLERAARDLAAWRKGTDVTVSVNVAPIQLRSATFPERVAAIFAAHGVSPSALTLEITERVLLDDRPAYMRAMAELRELGVQIALDDFGTGYSALSYLSRFPLDVLKIDRGFVAGLDSQPQARALLEAITGMASALGLRTVGEGIETARQLAQLAASGCDIGQGYHLARPLPVDELLPLLERVWDTGGADGEAPG